MQFTVSGWSEFSLKEGGTKKKQKKIGIFQIEGGEFSEGSISNFKKNKKNVALKWSTCSETWNKQIFFCDYSCV